ncbi:dTMP kinase [Hansschlegelia plantiphila]|uniref:Thymidylate kinase n=1 Tax=Hansschlegelia plantiphila TaxID=374655 RepID=A0A9W6IYF6_9HYPH|nr:dTMP kinase [Hansschlegelia plantiphila]GLK67470.1 thymidylate kinase [Hansschlegelia plantiphila]
MPESGVFIAVEGGDGAGKGGLIAAIVGRLGALGRTVTATREPGGTPEGEALRGLLLAETGAVWDARSELLLMTAARVQHVERVIRPALAQGEIVVSDRYVGSTIAYQGAGRGLSQAFIRGLHRDAVGDLWPDLTVFLDVEPVVGIGRSKRRLDAGAIDEGRFEGLDLAFHARVRESYLDQARTLGEKAVVIDAARTPAEVQAAAISAIGRSIGVAL